jgi:hypothetical protein
MTLRRLLASGVALVVVACACAGPRAFAGDDRVWIVAPTALSTVTPPFTVRWTASGDAAAYAVFVDRDPIRPGHGFRDVADDQCKRLPHCPDVFYLATRNIYVSTSSSVQIPVLPVVGGAAGAETHAAHVATLVRLDSRLHRVGDAFWTVEFRG